MQYKIKEIVTQSILLSALLFSLTGTNQLMAHEGHDVPPSKLETIKMSKQRVVFGDASSIGSGRFHAIQKSSPHGVPELIGIAFHRSTLIGLPIEASDGLNCWDNNNDGEISLDHDAEECTGGHQRILFFDENKSPFKFISINWEPLGHVPPGIYDIPHFDFHFYTQSYLERNLIAVGPCAGIMSCNALQRALKPLPAGYLHPDYVDTTLAFGRMGNHWVDSKTPELNGGTFTHTMIMGAYNGKITFYEPMVSLPFLQTKPNLCRPIKQPAKFQETAYYPTNYCIRYFPKNEYYSVTLEDFVYRTATE